MSGKKISPERNSQSSTASFESSDVSFRSDDYVRRLEILYSKGCVHLCRNSVSPDRVFQIIIRRPPSGAFTLFSATDRNEAERVLERLHQVLSPLDEYLTIKARGKLSRLLKSIVDLSLKEREWTWVHIAAQFEMYNVFAHKTPALAEAIDNNQNETKMTPLLVAIRAGKIELVKCILNLEPDLTLADHDGNTCLHLASVAATNLLRSVIKECHRRYGLRLFETRNKLGYTPFHFACYHEKFANVTEFLKIGLPIRILTLETIDPNINASKSPSSSSKRETHGVPIPFTQDMIADLETSDIKYGGSPLHWCKRRRLMLKLVNNGLSLNSFNLLGESPLHSMIRRCSLECMIPLLNYGADIDIIGPNGQPPLHFAAELGFREAVQALIVYDCNVNLKNAEGVTVRHLISRESSPVHLDILFILDKIGAARCPPNTEGCLEGCAAGGNFIGKPMAPWPDVEDFPLDDKLLKTESRIRRRSRSEKRGKKVKMLCLDGGGMKGLNAIQILIELQKRLEKPFIDYFEWIGATSTGAIIGSSLLIGRSLHQLRQDYFELKNEIFNRQRPHNTEALERILKKNMGSETKLESITNKKFMITSILADRDPPRLHLFRSYQPVIETTSPLPHRLGLDPANSTHNFALWEAVRASSAAPIFFKPYGPFIDGGLIANNPTLDCMSEFFKFNHIYEHRRGSSPPTDATEQLALVLSIGSGKPPSTPVENYDFGNLTFRRNPVGAFRSAIKYITLGELMVKLATNPDGHVVDRAQTWCASLCVPYYRLNASLSRRMSLDEVSDQRIIEGMLRTKLYIHGLGEKINEICDAIKSM